MCTEWGTRGMLIKSKKLSEWWIEKKQQRCSFANERKDGLGEKKETLF